MDKCAQLFDFLDKVQGEILNYKAAIEAGASGGDLENIAKLAADAEKQEQEIIKQIEDNGCIRSKKSRK
jgi:hypothetical protein